MRVFDEKFPVRNSLEQQVFTLGMHLICVSSGSYLQATEVSAGVVCFTVHSDKVFVRNQ